MGEAFICRRGGNSGGGGENLKKFAQGEVASSYNGSITVGGLGFEPSFITLTFRGDDYVPYAINYFPSMTGGYYFSGCRVGALDGGQSFFADGGYNLSVYDGGFGGNTGVNNTTVSWIAYE